MGACSAVGRGIGCRVHPIPGFGSDFPPRPTKPSITRTRLFYDKQNTDCPVSWPLVVLDRMFSNSWAFHTSRFSNIRSNSSIDGFSKSSIHSKSKIDKSYLNIIRKSNKLQTFKHSAWFEQIVRVFHYSYRQKMRRIRYSIIQKNWWANKSIRWFARKILDTKLTRSFIRSKIFNIEFIRSFIHSIKFLKRSTMISTESHCIMTKYAEK